MYDNLHSDENSINTYREAMISLSLKEFQTYAVHVRSVENEANRRLQHTWTVFARASSHIFIHYYRRLEEDKTLSIAQNPSRREARVKGVQNMLSDILQL